jgi:hypothetical protein
MECREYRARHANGSNGASSLMTTYQNRGGPDAAVGYALFTSDFAATVNSLENAL